MKLNQQTRWAGILEREHPEEFAKAEKLATAQ
jgi:hypothetical protein